MTTEVNKLTQQYQTMQLLITIREISTWHIQKKVFQSKHAELLDYLTNTQIFN